MPDDGHAARLAERFAALDDASLLEVLTSGLADHTSMALQVARAEAGLRGLPVPTPLPLPSPSPLQPVHPTSAAPPLALPPVDPAARVLLLLLIAPIAYLVVGIFGFMNGFAGFANGISPSERLFQRAVYWILIGGVLIACRPRAVEATAAFVGALFGFLAETAIRLVAHQELAQLFGMPGRRIQKYAWVPGLAVALPFVGLRERRRLRGDG